jgi:hypothetical protein
MKKTQGLYKRCSVTLDSGTIRRCQELARLDGQSFSSIVRHAIGLAYQRAVTERRIREVASERRLKG